MSLQSFQETLAVQQAAGTLFNTFSTAKSVINPQALYTLPPGFWSQPGKAMRITVAGGLSNIVTTPGTVTFQVMLGSNIAFTTGAIQLNATAHTLLPFWLDILLTCRAVGSGTSANLMGMGKLNGVMFTLTAAQVDAVNTQGEFSAPATAPAVGAGFDSTIANVLDFWTGFSVNNAGNGVQIQSYLAEALN